MKRILVVAWQGARLGFAAGNGVVYLINSNGDLLWYRHLGYGDGRAEWANGGTARKWEPAGAA